MQPLKTRCGTHRPVGRHPTPSGTHAVRLGLLLGGLAVLVACTERKREEPPDMLLSQVAAGPAITQRVSLEINGFNYTDLYIDSFEVNGQGGGNLFVSSPTSGGGGGVCCVSFGPGSRLPIKLTIKRWCEKEALVMGPIPANPRHLGVHFFPDGRIEAEITENYPELKLRLEDFNEAERKASGNTVVDEQTARCKDGY